MSKTCIECGKRELHAKGLCINCYQRQWRKNNPEKVIAKRIKASRKIGMLPMSKNRGCTQFLGVYVAERVLSKVFKDVEIQPYGNPGFDFICNHGKKIDVKSACLRQGFRGPHYWSFHIKQNKIADHFLCLAFNNRENLNPIYMWLIPRDKINHLVSAVISLTTVTKWSEYILPIDKVSVCCDLMKGEHI